MILHNLTIAFRNLWKYKSQTLISIIGLAVGFTCFALATLWIRYEMTFDSLHKNAKQLYVVYGPKVVEKSGYDRDVGYWMSSYLKGTFPEISDAISLKPSFANITIEGVELSVSTIQADSSFFRMFDVKVLEGNRDFLITGSNKFAITQKKALQLFGNDNPIGKTINNGDNEICAIVSDMPGKSNYAFDFIEPFSESMVSSQGFDMRSSHAIIELFPGTDVKALEKKLYEQNISPTRNHYINKILIKPITKIRYTDPDIKREVKIQHILIFSISGILVILCSLFNYLTLFVNRFRIRQKELALRVVCGASGGSLMSMLSVEFILTLLFAVALGFMLTQWLHKPFLSLSDIQMDLFAIYRESLFYIMSVILIAFLAFWLILYIFRKRNLNLSLRRSNKYLSRKISVTVQLVISIVFAFCTIVLLKQIYFLHHTNELGFSFQKRGSVQIMETVITETKVKDNSVLVNQLEQIPEITEILCAGMNSDLLFPNRMSFFMNSWDDKPADAQPIEVMIMSVSHDYFSFYNLQLVSGEILTDINSNVISVLLNESAAKAFGWDDPIGKFIEHSYKVTGVIKNIYNLEPTMEVKPILYLITTNSDKPFTVTSNNQTIIGRVVLFKYSNNMWKSCKEKIEQLIQKEYTDYYYTKITNNEEEYNKYLKSENNLIKLLTFISAICIFICVFGFVSLVSLTCEERRKEIAIRKINGATVDDIIAIFAKEYSLLLMIGAVIAFSAGYFIMQRWLENYVKQTNIPAWIYLVIILTLALIIILCVGWQVYKASVENPAETVKS